VRFLWVIDLAGFGSFGSWVSSLSALAPSQSGNLGVTIVMETVCVGFSSLGSMWFLLY
jgi:hypothetical protein